MILSNFNASGRQLITVQVFRFSWFAVGSGFHQFDNAVDFVKRIIFCRCQLSAALQIVSNASDFGFCSFDIDVDLAPYWFAPPFVAFGIAAVNLEDTNRIGFGRQNTYNNTIRSRSALRFSCSAASSAHPEDWRQHMIFCSLSALTRRVKSGISGCYGFTLAVSGQGVIRKKSTLSEQNLDGLTVYFTLGHSGSSHSATIIRRNPV